MNEVLGDYSKYKSESHISNDSRTLQSGSQSLRKFCVGVYCTLNLGAMYTKV